MVNENIIKVLSGKCAHSNSDDCFGYEVSSNNTPSEFLYGSEIEAILAAIARTIAIDVIVLSTEGIGDIEFEFECIYNSKKYTFYFKNDIFKSLMEKMIKLTKEMKNKFAEKLSVEEKQYWMNCFQIRLNIIIQEYTKELEQKLQEILQLEKELMQRFLKELEKEFWKRLLRFYW